MNTIEDYMKFIENTLPKFEKVNEGFRMFTDSTQWIEGSSIQELLDKGIEAYNRFNGMSPLKFIIQNIEPLEYEVEYTEEDLKNMDEYVFNIIIEEMNEKIFNRKE